MVVIGGQRKSLRFSSLAKETRLGELDSDFFICSHKYMKSMSNGDLFRIIG